MNQSWPDDELMVNWWWTDDEPSLPHSSRAPASLLWSIIIFFPITSSSLPKCFLSGVICAIWCPVHFPVCQPATRTLFLLSVYFSAHAIFPSFSCPSCPFVRQWLSAFSPVHRTCNVATATIPFLLVKLPQGPLFVWARHEAKKISWESGSRIRMRTKTSSPTQQ